MDTINLLGQALECSVCLEQLDCTSRVLPCQHTFCRRCLLDIINTRKELRCPECRTLVTTPFNSLPPNILLVRILEEIKNMPANSTSATEGNRFTAPSISSCNNSSSDPFSFFHKVSSSGDTGSLASSTGGITSGGSSPSLNRDSESGRHTHALLQSSPSNPFLNNESQTSEPDTSITDLISRIRNRATAIESQAVLSSNFVPKSTWSSCRLSESVPSSSLITSRNSITNPTYSTSNRVSNILTNPLIQSYPINQSLVNVSETLVPTASASDDVSARTERLNALRLSSATSLNASQACGSSSSQNFVPLIQAKALYNYDGKDTRDLKFKKGDTITLCKQIDDNWYQGELEGRTGIVPASYIKLMSSTITSVIPQCKALYDFKVVSEEERNCLMFNKGETITVLRRVDGNWAEGKLNAHIGIFPLSFVELNDSAKALIRIPGSVAPPAPIHSPVGSSLITATVSTSSPCTTTPSCTVTPALLTGIPSPAHFASQSPQPYQNGLSTTPSSVRSGSSSLSTSRPASGSTQGRMPGSVTPDTESRKTLTLANLESLQLYIAMYSYRPRKADELELKKSLLYSASEKCHDGWFKGRCLTTDKIGVFPGNYVQLADAQTITAFLARSTMGLRTVAALSAGQQRGTSPGNRTSPSHTLTPGTYSRSKSNSPGASSAGDSLLNIGNGSACPPELPPRVFTSSGKPIADRACNLVAPGPLGNDKKSTSPGYKERSPGTGTGNGISLMRKLTSGKRNSKSPPILSMDNPVFEETNTNANRITRSGSSNEDDERTNKQPAPLIRERFRCVVPYPANSRDELELQLGDVVYVHKKMEDGWYKGTLQKNGKTGLFPSIFVESC